MTPKEILDALNSALDPIKTTGRPTGPDAPSYLPNAVIIVVTAFLYIAGIVLILAILYGGLQYITSAGDEAKATKGRQSIVYGVIGTTIVVLSFATIKIIRDLVGSV